jgi:hypothetical protein
MKATAETDKQRWEREILDPALKKSPERPEPFTTISGRPIDRLYTPNRPQRRLRSADAHGP